MAKKNHKMNYLIWTLMFVGVAGLFMSGANQNKYFAFELSPSEIKTLDYSGNIELPNVLCYTKVTTNGFDSTGKIVLTDDSPFLQKHPRTTYSLVGGADNSEVVKFEVTPKIRCEVDGNVAMTVKNAPLKAFVMAKNSKSQEIEVWNNIQTAKNIPIKNNHEETLAKFTVNTSDLAKYMENGDYESLLTFQVSGYMEIVYDVLPNIQPYRIDIPRDSIMTFIELQVVKDAPVGTQGNSNNPNGDSSGSDPSTENYGTEPIVDDLKRMSLCAKSYDLGCLTNRDFIPYYLGGIGLIFAVGAVTTNNKPMFDQFGNRLR